MQVFHVCEPNHAISHRFIDNGTSSKMSKVLVMVVVNCCDNAVLIFFADRVFVPLNPHP